MEFVDFSLIGPVSTRFTNYFAISLKNSCVRRKHRIKILKTIRPRYCNYLGRMVFRFPIYNTEQVKEFFETKSKKNIDKSPIIRCFDSRQVGNTYLNLGAPKNSFSKKVSFEYTHTYLLLYHRRHE